MASRVRGRVRGPGGVGWSQVGRGCGVAAVPEVGWSSCSDVGCPGAGVVGSPQVVAVVVVVVVAALARETAAFHVRLSGSLVLSGMVVLWGVVVPVWSRW